MQTLKIYDYPIYIGDIWQEFDDFLKKNNYHKIFILIDKNTEKHCFSRFIDHFPTFSTYNIAIRAGEIEKNMDTCQAIWQAMFEHGGDRKSLMLNLGGGVIGDIGGFAAATFKRGIDFIQMPTTLLSQVDSSIGGKLGLDFHGIKNSIGVFANPKAVFILPDFLETLSAREIRSGFAEIIKHALIADAKQWAKLKKIRDLTTVDWTKIITPSLKIKQRIVKIDPFERGLRKALNFGHTIGHAVESMALTTPNSLTHGEAIAIGMICEAYLSTLITEFPETELTEIATFIFDIYEKYNIQQFDFQHLIALMQQDKKNETDDINFTLLHKIGTPLVNKTATIDQIKDSLMFYNTYEIT